MACPNVPGMGVIAAGSGVEYQTRNLQDISFKVGRGVPVTGVVFRFGHAIKHVKTDFVVGAVQKCGMVLLLVVEDGIPVANVYSSAS